MNKLTEKQVIKYIKDKTGTIIFPQTIRRAVKNGILTIAEREPTANNRLRNLYAQDEIEKWIVYLQSYTINQLAREIGVTPYRIKQIVNAGEVQRIGNPLRIPPAEADKIRAKFSKIGKLQKQIENIMEGKSNA